MAASDPSGHSQVERPSITIPPYLEILIEQVPANTSQRRQIQEIFLIGMCAFEKDTRTDQHYRTMIRATEAIKGEQLVEATGEPDDEAYNKALVDAHEAVTSLTVEDTVR